MVKGVMLLPLVLQAGMAYMFETPSSAVRFHALSHWETLLWKVMLGLFTKVRSMQPSVSLHSSLCTAWVLAFIWGRLGRAGLQCVSYTLYLGPTCEPVIHRLAPYDTFLPWFS